MKAVGYRTILAMVIALTAISAVHADMMPVDQLQGEGLQSSPVWTQVSALPACVEATVTHGPGGTDLNLTSVALIPQANADVEQICQTEPLHVLAYEPGSLNLCLYALIGLGLCRSAPWVKKLSFGYVPDWYHDGGPYQIGHSRAIGPEFLCRAAVDCCFIQLDETCEVPLSQCYLGTVVSLLRKSLFVPGRLSSRGPPVNA